MMQELFAISPVDGRYANRTTVLNPYFSEFGLIKYRVLVEVKYFKALSEANITGFLPLSLSQHTALDEIVENFSAADAQEIKDIEKITNHDVKAVEYFLKNKFDTLGLSEWKEYIHFGLTSQDINNTATPLLLKDALVQVIRPAIVTIREALAAMAKEWAAVPMLARTHGQPASPTLLGKEIMVFVERLDEQLEQLDFIKHKAKFGGATGNLNAHYVTFPQTDWHSFANHFVTQYLGLKRAQVTTQIEHYDNIAAICHAMARINTILLDFCKDIWTYISMNYFRQRVVATEVGSSAMPHKVNPIDFENGEGNLGIANAIFEHLAAKLPISRLQRDLTDSTVSRNLGVPFAHCLIAYSSINKGLSKLLLNADALHDDLERNYAVVAEAIQSILRREKYPKPYEALKDFTRGKPELTGADISAFIDSLAVSEELKSELRQITPHNYTGKFNI